MRCHQCNQDSIEVKDSKISCEVCGLSIDCSNLDSELCDLFLYNKEVEEAEELGRIAYREDKGVEENPYSLSSSQIILNHSWKQSYRQEEMNYEREAFFSSAENLNKELKRTLKDKVRDRELSKRQEKQLLSHLLQLKELIKDLDSKEYWLGRTYRQDISTIITSIEDMT